MFCLCICMKALHANGYSHACRKRRSAPNYSQFSWETNGKGWSPKIGSPLLLHLVPQTLVKMDSLACLCSMLEFELGFLWCQRFFDWIRKVSRAKNGTGGGNSVLFVNITLALTWIPKQTSWMTLPVKNINRAKSMFHYATIVHNLDWWRWVVHIYMWL